jgi:Tol biopolymer transport system component
MAARRLSHPATAATSLFAAALVLLAACGSDPAPPSRSAKSSPPPLEGRILFQQEVDGVWQLFSIAPDGSGRRQLTHRAGAAVDADWSPDGRRIVFEYDRPNEDGCEIYLMNADGSGLRDLSRSPLPSCDLNPSFTPDGKRIVFVRYFQPADQERIMSMDLKGGDVRRIGGHLGDIDPNVSPDGHTVTFVRRKREDELQALMAIGMDGKGLRRLTPYTDDINLKHAWSPDGKVVAVTTNADYVRPEESANIVTLSPDRSTREPLTRFTGGIEGSNGIIGSFSPDGRHIALRFERNDAGRLAIMAVDGSGLRLITPASDSKPKSIDWGPAA